MGAVFADLQTAILDVVKTTARFRSTFQRLETTILAVKPMFDNMERLCAVLNRTERETAMFVDRMREGKELILKSSKVKQWNLYKKYVYSKKLKKFDKSLRRFFQIDVQAAQSMYIRQIIVTMKTGAVE